MISSQFREQVEAFIAAHGFKPTEFGRQALGDPSFVMTLRRGRSPRLATAEKVLSFMEEFEQTDRKRARQRRSA
jgi:predicted transcriptional regulator